MNRQPQSICIVGAQETGKTTLADELIQKSARPKTLIIDSDGAEEKWHKYQLITTEQISVLKKGIARVIFDEEDPTFMKRIRRTFKNGLLVFDDAPYYLAEANPKPFQQIFMKNRQTNNDIIWVCHGLSDIPPKLWSYISYLIIFNTTDSFERKKSSLPAVKAMAKRVMDVKKLAAKNPHAKKFYRLR